MPFKLIALVLPLSPDTFAVSAALGVGISVSLDELAIGFAIGLLHMPVLVVGLLIGAQAVVASQLGVRLGGRLGREFRERAEQVAGVLLITLGIGLALLRLTGHSV